jgi:hypothetical protein
VVLLAVIGLALAVGVRLAANAISRNSIELAPTPVGSWRRLAPGRRGRDLSGGLRGAGLVLVTCHDDPTTTRAMTAPAATPAAPGGDGHGKGGGR